jgi:hypothetical protein
MVELRGVRFTKAIIDERQAKFDAIAFRESVRPKEFPCPLIDPGRGDGATGNGQSASGIPTTRALSVSLAETAVKRSSWLHAVTAKAMKISSHVRIRHLVASLTRVGHQPTCQRAIHCYALAFKLCFVGCNE